MKNIASFIDFSLQKNYGFFIDEINPIITEYLKSRDENKFSEAARYLGVISEAALKELYKSYISSEDDPSFSNLLYQIKNCDDLNVKMSPPIETLLRFTINLRNISSHKTTDSLRNFIMIADEIKIEECIVAEKMTIKIIKWFLANKGFDISNIPNYTYVIDQRTITQNVTIPKLHKDSKSFQNITIPENAEIHLNSMIIDYLIRGFSLVEISNKYFNESDDEGKIAYKILVGHVGLNSKWQEVFKTNNYKDLINLLDQKEHKVLIEAIRFHIKKSN